MYLQGTAAFLIFSGGHPGAYQLQHGRLSCGEDIINMLCLPPGGGLRARSEAEVMFELAENLTTTTKAQSRSVRKDLVTLFTSCQNPEGLTGHAGARWLKDQNSTSTRQNALYSLQIALEHRCDDHACSGRAREVQVIMQC